MEKQKIKYAINQWTSYMPNILKNHLDFNKGGVFYQEVLQDYVINDNTKYISLKMLYTYEL